MELKRSVVVLILVRRWADAHGFARTVRKKWKCYYSRPSQQQRLVPAELEMVPPPVLRVVPAQTAAFPFWHNHQQSTQLALQQVLLVRRNLPLQQRRCRRLLQLRRLHRLYQAGASALGSAVCVPCEVVP